MYIGDDYFIPIKVAKSDFFLFVELGDFWGLIEDFLYY